MDQTAQQIEEHITQTRDDLGSNLEELEQKVKSVTDWKQHFKSKPLTMLGVAFGGGILLATMAGRPNTRTTGRSAFSRDMTSADNAKPIGNRERVVDTWDNIKSALVGVAATRFTDFVGEIVPGFQDHFKRTSERSQGRHGLHGEMVETRQ